MIKAIVFDFDGLIIDTETVWYEAFREVAKEYNIDLPLEEFAKCIGTHDDVLYEYFEQKVGIEINRAEIRKRAGEIHRQKMKQIQAREGVEQYITAAKELGLKVGLATSSTREWVERFLNELKLYEQFEVIKTRDDVENVKPDPELYTKAVEALGVQPQEAIAFEDSANGAKAAIAAGLQCVIVPNEVTSSLIFEKYHLRMSSMGDMSLKDVILNIEQGYCPQ